MKNHILTFNDFIRQLDAQLINAGYKKYNELYNIEYCLLYKNEELVESFYCFFRIHKLRKCVEYIDNKDYNPIGKHSAIGKDDLTKDNLEKLFKLSGDIITQFKKKKIIKKIQDLNKDFE